MSTAPNPLMGSWPGNGGLLTPPPQVPTGPPVGQWGNPGGYGNPNGAREIQRNTALNNIQAGQYRNQLLPLFSQLMMNYGGDAGNFFKQLMNLGSPFYQQKQRQSFDQGVKSGNDAAAQARQGVAASGAGFTPSGVGAAMMGGMGVGQARNQAELFLNNLFQNEQLQTAGAQGMGQMASLFNPAQLTGQQTSQGGQIDVPSSFFQNFQQTMNGIFGQGGAAGGAQTGYNIAGGK